MKKFIALTVSVIIIALTFVACMGGNNVSEDNNGQIDNKKTVTLRLWGAQDDKEMLTKLIDQFKKDHPEKEWDIKISYVGEDDAATEILKDVIKDAA